MHGPEGRRRRALARIGRHSLTRFAAFGALGLAFDVTLLWLIVAFSDLSRAAAITIAFAVTYLLNFFLNRRFAFAVEGRVGRQLLRFAPQLAVDYLLTLSAVEILAGLGVTLILARIVAGGTNAAFNYVTYRWWTLRPGRPTAIARVKQPAGRAQAPAGDGRGLEVPASDGVTR